MNKYTELFRSNNTDLFTMHFMLILYFTHAFLITARSLYYMTLHERMISKTSIVWLCTE